MLCFMNDFLGMLFYALQFMKTYTIRGLDYHFPA